jgi:hypothetical protein
MVANSFVWGLVLTAVAWSWRSYKLKLQQQGPTPSTDDDHSLEVENRMPKARTSRVVLGISAILTMLAGAAIVLVTDLPGLVRAELARSRIKAGMTLPAAFDALESVDGAGEWNGLLSGYECRAGRAWALSRTRAGYVFHTHLEATPLEGQGDWKRHKLPDAAAVRRFLDGKLGSSCSRHGTGFGDWYFVFTIDGGRVAEIGSVKRSSD